MARSTEPAAHALIVRDPRVCGGEPTVSGTRIPVRSIVVAHQTYGDVDRVRAAYPRLDPTAIRGALAFYQANQREIDRLIEESERVAYQAD